MDKRNTRDSAILHLVALVELPPEVYPADVREPLRLARDKAAAHLAQRFAKAWEESQGARDRVRDAAARVGIAPNVWRRIQRGIPEVNEAIPAPPIGRPKKST